MTFEEDFPSLKVAEIKGLINAEVGILDVYWKQDIRKYCLDKQRVRDAIKKCNQESKDAFQSMIPMMLIKELGLGGVMPDTPIIR